MSCHIRHSKLLENYYSNQENANIHNTVFVKNNKNLILAEIQPVLTCLMLF